MSFEVYSSFKVRGETVVLLHGLGRSRLSLLWLQLRLRRVGYRTLNFGYSPVWTSLDGISQNLIHYVQERVRTPVYHFLGHSLGNIIVRNGFKWGYPPGLRRVVMLAPPNQLPLLARRLRGNWVYRLLAGDSGQKLASEGFYRSLPIPTVEFGVIAANCGLSFYFGEPNDGILTVESTKLEGMKDWILVPHTHTFLMNGRDTFEYTVRFLQKGRFR